MFFVKTDKPPNINPDIEIRDEYLICKKHFILMTIGIGFILGK